MALRDHIEKCRSYGPNIKAKKYQKVLFFSKSNEVKAIGSTQVEITKGCVKMIIIDELPFSFVEGEGFRHFCEMACAHWNVPSRKTIARDVINLFYSEKEKL